MEDQELLRYSKQIMLPQVDVEGQQKIMDATVLIVGMGGLGSPTALYLAAAGVGHLIIADFDQVELSNLQRQIIHQTKDIGDDKVNSAKNKLTELNPNIKITIANELIHTGNLPNLIKGVDIVLDGTDNFESRFEINQIREITGLNKFVGNRDLNVWVELSQLVLCRVHLVITNVFGLMNNLSL